MPRPLAAIFTRLPFVFPPALLWLAGTAAKRRLIHPRMAPNNVDAWQDLEKKLSFRETPLTHRGAGRLRAQLRGVTVERCSEYGIIASDGGSVELTGCSLRGNGTDYKADKGGRFSSAGTITADGRRVG